MIDAEALTLTDPAGTRTTSEAVVRCTYAAALEPMNEMPCHAMHGVRYVRAFAYAALIAAVRSRIINACTHASAAGHSRPDPVAHPPTGQQRRRRAGAGARPGSGSPGRDEGAERAPTTLADRVKVKCDGLDQDRSVFAHVLDCASGGGDH